MKRRRRRATTVVFVGCMLAGCTLPAPPAPVPVVQPMSEQCLVRLHSEDVAGLVQYWADLQRLPESQLKEEYQCVSQQFQDRPHAFNRLRLVHLLLVPDAPFADNDQALELLRQYVKQPNAVIGEYGNYARLLLSCMEQREREREQRADLEQQLAGERERRTTVQEKLKELQQQLEEMKDIEKTLNEREAVPPVVPIR